jgi:hypothetical protein
MKQGIEAFLSLHVDLENVKPFRTKRDARDEAMRLVGFAQAQEQLRHILSQCHSQTAAELASAPPPEGALRPMQGPGGMRLWMPPELPTR